MLGIDNDPKNDKKISAEKIEMLYKYTLQSTLLYLYFTSVIILVVVIINNT